MKKTLCILALLSTFLALPVFAQQSGSYTVTVNPAPLTMTPPSGALPAMTVDTAYSTTITIAGGVAPYTVKVSAGALPPGNPAFTAAISGSTLTIAGTPTTSVGSPFAFTLTVSDSSGLAKVMQFKTGPEVAKR